MRYGTTRRQAYRQGVWDGIGYAILAACLVATGFTLGVLI